jgi:hypothetical protein
MKSYLIYTIALAFVLTSCSKETPKEEPTEFDPNIVLASISDRVLNVLREDSSTRLPRNVEDGQIRFTSAKSWTSGFFPGMLWMLDSYNTSEEWETLAKKHTEKLEEVQYVTDHHDLGFMLYSSYGKGYEKLGDEEYKNVLLTGAESLASRYDPMIGMIKSWDRPGKWQYPVIIDNMMNLEYFFWVTQITGDSSYYDMAYSHAKRTLKDHFRDDYGSYHVVDYDTLTGEVIWKGTHQGLADESVWSRGQAWGLYGFTMAFRETGDSAFLERAVQIASFLFDNPNMPDDKIPYWDLKDPSIPDAPKDVSAAAIIASALLELQAYAPEKRDDYVALAQEILQNLEDNYRYRESDEASYFYLDQSVGNKPKDKEVSVPIVYADYYFIEALLRMREITS